MNSFSRRLMAFSLSLIITVSAVVNVFSAGADLAEDEIERAQTLGFAFDWEIEYLDDELNRDDFVWMTIRFLAVQYHVSYKMLISERERLPEDTAALEALGFNSFYDSTSEDDEIALACGIIRGRGDGGYDPEALITREEAASILYNLYRYYSHTTPETEMIVSYEDWDKIAEWAKDPVLFCASLDLLPREENMFVPHMTVTTREAFHAFMRLYENAEYGRVHHNLEHPWNYEAMKDALHNLSGYHAIHEEETDRYGVFYFYQEAPSMNRRFWILYKDGGGIDYSMVLFDTLDSWPFLWLFEWNADGTKLACQHTAGNGLSRVVQFDPEKGTVEVRP